jgi:amidase
VLAQRPDLGQLALAGVSVAVKEVAAVTGEASGVAIACATMPFDGVAVRSKRLRAAGSVIIGTTRTPQCCLFPMTDDADAIVTNPHGLLALPPVARRTAASSGRRRFGSPGPRHRRLRIDTYACGHVGISPGIGTVAAVDAGQWSGLYRLLSVLAERPELATVSPAGVMRVATSVRPPGLADPVPSGSFTRSHTPLHSCVLPATTSGEQHHARHSYPLHQPHRVRNTLEIHLYRSLDSHNRGSEVGADYIDQMIGSRQL